MFYGGTNFGFMAGANWDGNAPYYIADTTSYGMTKKYFLYYLNLSTLQLLKFLM